MTAKERSKTKVDSNVVSVESAALLGLLADIRAAVGDPNGKLMQDELVEHCCRVTNAAQKAEALADFWDKHGGGNGVMARSKEDAMILACRSISWPDAQAEAPPPAPQRKTPREGGTTNCHSCGVEISQSALCPSCWHKLAFPSENAGGQS